VKLEGLSIKNNGRCPGVSVPGVPGERPRRGDVQKIRGGTRPLPFFFPFFFFDSYKRAFAATGCPDPAGHNGDKTTGAWGFCRRGTFECRGGRKNPIWKGPAPRRTKKRCSPSFGFFLRRFRRDPGRQIYLVHDPVEYTEIGGAARPDLQRPDNCRVRRAAAGPGVLRPTSTDGRKGHAATGPNKNYWGLQGAMDTLRSKLVAKRGDVTSRTTPTRRRDPTLKYKDMMDNGWIPNPNPAAL